MRAAFYREFGDAAEVIEVGELPEPEAGPGEVTVELAFSGVNPVDVKRRAGGRGEMTAPRVIPHFDGSGVVTAVGEGVDEARVGQRVWVYEANWRRTSGTAARFVRLPAERAVALPAGVDLEIGACLGIPALTAHRCVFGDGTVAGETVLVTGGAGAVGNYAVQFAALDGAIVIATVSSDPKAALARKAGAAHVIDYREQDVAAEIDALTGGEGVGRIVEVEFGGNLESSLTALKPGGVIAAYASEAVSEPRVPFYEFLYRAAVVRHELVFRMPEAAKRRAVQDITRWLEEDRLLHHVARRFPLEETARAHEAVERGAFGKVLVRVDEGLVGESDGG